MAEFLQKILFSAHGPSLFAAVILTICVLPAPHHAIAQVLDNVIGNEPSERVDTPLPEKDDFKTSVPAFVRPEALFPKGFGLTEWLWNRGVGLKLDNTNEFAGAITPPTRGKTPGFENYKQGASNAGQYAIGLDMDWEHLAGIRGFATHVIFVGRYGTTANRMFGDWLNHASETYGGGGNVVVHLVMAYGEENLYGGRIAIAAGRMAEMSDFQNSPLFCNFQNGSICGRPKAATDSAFVSGYPASVWAGRIRVRPARLIYAQIGLYAAEKGIYTVDYNRSGFRFDSAIINGFRLPLAAGYEPVFDGKFPGHYKIGAVLSTAQSPDNFYDNAGQPFARTHQPERLRRDTFGTWFMADQRLINHYHDKQRGLTLMTGFLYNDKRTALREWQTYLALVDRGFLRSRPYDTLGFSLTYEKMPPGVQKTDALYLQESNFDLPNHATGIQRHTAVLEANYAIHVWRGVIFQPVFEYYFRPNGQANLRNAALLGFKTHVEIF